MGSGEPDPIVQAALARGFITPAQLEEARELERSLAAAGQSPGLRALLAQRFLTPAQVSALRDQASQRAASQRALAQGGEGAPTVTEATGPLRPLELQPGTAVGGYVIEGVLGRGGMGAVYAARDPATGAPVALKLLAATDPKALERFRREGVAQAKVDRHPNVLRVFASGELQGAPYLVMELAPGGDLAKQLAEGPMPPVAAAALVAQLARGLAHVHAHGILHRDLKPQNVMFDADGAPKLVDFGVARLRGEQDLTRTGDLVGTPSYMAPEQAEGARGAIDERTDVYGLGAILYHCVTGRPPFQGEVHQVLKAVLMDPPAPPSTIVPGLPPDVDHLVLKCLSKDPADRYPSARALAEDLERLARGEAVLGRDEAGARRRARARVRVALAALGVGALAIGGARLWRSSRGGEETNEQTRLVAPKGTLASAHGKTRTTLGSVRVDLAVTGDVRASRLLVGTSVVEQVDGPLELRAHPVPLELGRNVLRLEAQPEGSADWTTLARLEVERRAEFDPPPPAQVTDRKGRTIALDEVREEYVTPEGLVLVYVPPGKFTMGDENITHMLALDEHGDQLVAVASPPHDVVHTHGFLIGKHEVSWAQVERWKAATGRTKPVRPDGFEDAFPAVDISWHDARAYCEWVGLELPTEAQWEWAARGPKRGDVYPLYPWGNEPPALDGDRAVFGRASGGAPVAVDDPRYAAGASWVGAMHMAGNAWEWCEDIFVPIYSVLVETEPPPRRDPRNPGGDDAPSWANRTTRGGSWRTDPKGELHHLQCAFRRPQVADLTKGGTDGKVPRTLHHDDGFRVALSLRPR